MFLLVQPPSNKLHTILVSYHVFCNAYTIVRRALVLLGLSPDGGLFSLSPHKTLYGVRGGVCHCICNIFGLLLPLGGLVSVTRDPPSEDRNSSGASLHTDDVIFLYSIWKLSLLPFCVFHIL